jgi:hypothetical protein
MTGKSLSRALSLRGLVLNFLVMDDDQDELVPSVRFPSRRHALLYLCLLATLLISFGWLGLAGAALDRSCPDTASAADCPADLALVLPIMVGLASGVCLCWLARRTVRSLAASGVPIRGWKGMPLWMTVELLLLLGLFMPVALRQLRGREE